MKKKYKESKYHEDWLLKARRDLDNAFLHHQHGGYTDTTCYFCHQAAEKALKSYLLYRGLKSLPHIHILPTLLSMCEKHDKDFADLKENCQILDKYYIETKYPLSPPVDYPKQEAQKAIDLTSKVLDFVEKKIR